MVLSLLIVHLRVLASQRTPFVSVKAVVSNSPISSSFFCAFSPRYILVRAIEMPCSSAQKRSLSHTTPAFGEKTPPFS